MITQQATQYTGKMDIKKALKEAYSLLPKGSQTMAADVFGSSREHLKRIVDGDVEKDESELHRALCAIRQGSKNFREKISLQVEKIASIEVNQPEEIKSNE